jgi:hypothetical protein
MIRCVMVTIYEDTDMNTDDGPQHWTDYEAIVLYLALARRKFATHSPFFREELREFPEIEFLFERHSFGSVSMRWNDFRTAVNPDLKPTKGAGLKQVRRIIQDWEWLTEKPLRPDLISVAA